MNYMEMYKKWIADIGLFEEWKCPCGNHIRMEMRPGEESDG